MALVRRLQHDPQASPRDHEEKLCTYSIVDGGDGVFLQIDTFSSQARRDQRHHSQTIRFAPEALCQLKAILDNEPSIRRTAEKSPGTSRRIGILTWQ